MIYVIPIVLLVMSPLLGTLFDLSADFLPGWYKTDIYLVIGSITAILVLTVALTIIFSKISPKTEPPVIFEDEFLARSDKFFGRSQEQEKIINLLNNPKVSILNIYGIGGVGKTSLVKEIVDKKIFETVIWQTAKKEVFDIQQGIIKQPLESSLTLETLCRNIAQRFGKLTEYKALKKEYQKFTLLESLLKKNKSLLIIDNFETIDEKFNKFVEGLKNIIEDTSSKAVLTCRFKVETIENFLLEGLNLGEAKQLLNNELAIFDNENVLLHKNAQEIHEATKGVPLAIKLIASRIKTSHEAVVNNIIDRFSNIDFNNQNEIYEQCYLFIYRQIWADLSKNAKVFLIKLATYSIDEKITKEELESAYFSKNLTGSKVKKEEFLETFSELLKHVLIEVKSTNNIHHFSLHPLTQKFVNADLRQIKN